MFLIMFAVSKKKPLGTPGIMKKLRGGWSDRDKEGR